jgi:hypothetical protein
MLDERSLRKPTCSVEDSTPIVMADGRPWLFRRPFLRMRAKFAGGKAAESRMVPYLEGGSELESLLDALTGEGDFLAAVMNIGAYLLSFNYDLSDEALGEIFSFAAISGDDPMEWARQIVRCANGADAPKAPTSGGAAASS